MDTITEMNRRNDISLNELADMIEMLAQWADNDPYRVQLSILSMEWGEAMTGLKALLKQQDMIESQRNRLEKLLVELEFVKPIAEKLKLTWYE